MTGTPLFGQEDLLDLFKKMDAWLGTKGEVQEFTLIGSATLIAEGMPGRSTSDVDFWNTSEEDHAKIRAMAAALDIPLDPENETDRKVPHLSWVGNEFIELPDHHHWINDTQDVWAGQHLRLVRPPTGISLGSKLIAFRSQDIPDIHWLVDNDPEWNQSLQRYMPLFSERGMKEIERNLIFVHYHIQAKESKDSPETVAARTLPGRRQP